MQHPSELDTLFSEGERAEIAATETASGPDALRLAAAWSAHVDKIDSDRPLTRTNRSVWTEHDLAAALFIRDFLAGALAALRTDLAARLADHVSAADDRFRSFTVRDSGERMARIAQVDLDGREWWWFRVPVTGPIAQDLAGH